jgi:hypothetical protein
MAEHEEQPICVVDAVSAYRTNRTEDNSRTIPTECEDRSKIPVFIYVCIILRRVVVIISLIERKIRRCNEAMMTPIDSHCDEQTNGKLDRLVATSPICVRESHAHARVRRQQQCRTPTVDRSSVIRHRFDVRRFRRESMTTLVNCRRSVSVCRSIDMSTSELGTATFDGHNSGPIVPGVFMRQHQSNS